jgi:Sortase domain
MSLVVAAGLLLVGCGDGDHAARLAAPDRRAPTKQGTVHVPASVRHFRSTSEVPARPLPKRLRIPSIAVDTPLEYLSRDRAGHVEVPRHWQRAGWYRDGARPGEPGAAVLLGHVDSPFGPAVFAGLSTLRPGARVLVDRADGSTVAFRVTRVELRSRKDFPRVQVYWPTLERELRLITCGGSYVKSAGGYQSNVIAFARAERPGSSP